MAGPIDPGAYREALIVLGTAGVVIPAFHRLRINPILGFLIAGTIIGPNVLGSLAVSYPWLSYLVLGDTEQIAQLAELGVVFLLFMVGIELSFERVVALRRLVFGFGTIQILGATAVIAGGLLLMGLVPLEALIVGLALSLSSTAIVIQLLSDQRRLGTQTGRTSFAVLLMQDLAVVPILLMVQTLASNAQGAVSLGISTALVKALLTILIIVVVGRFALRPLLRLVAATRSTDLFLAATLLIVVGAAFITNLGGLSMALGAFIAGLLIAETEYRREVETLIEPFKGLLLGAYFLLVGMGMDLRLLFSEPLAILGLTIALIAVKVAVTYLAGLPFKVPRAALLKSSLLLGPGGEFAFVILPMAVTGGLVAAATSNRILLAVSASMMLIPALGRLGTMLASRLGPPADIDPQVLLEPSEPTPPQAIIAGYGRVGALVSSLLEEHNIDYLAIDADPQIVSRARRAGKPIYYGNAARADFLIKCGIEKASALVVTMDEPDKIDHVVRTVRELRPDIKIVARARHENHAMELYGIGVSEAVPETTEASLQLGEAVLVEVGVPMGFAIATIHERRDKLRRLLGRPDRRSEVGLARRRLKQKENQ